MDEQWISEPSRKTPLLHDVVVVGGGTAGCVAAIAAARAGADTALIERFGTLGGCPTVGRCAHIGNRFIDDQMRLVIGGLPFELMDRVAAEGGTRFPTLEQTIRGESSPRLPPMASSYALLMRMGNVDHQRFMGYVLSLPAGQPDPGFDGWLADRLETPVEELRNSRYWRFFLDPQPVDEGVPRNHPGKAGFTPDALDWYRERWVTEGDFSYVELHFFRDKIRQAVDNGDLELVRPIDGIGRLGLNYDGVAGSAWRNGEVVINGINVAGPDAFNTEHVAKLEVHARRRVLEIARFMKKYIPGFEDAYIVDTGAQTLPRHIRNIEAEYSLTHEDLQQTDGYPDAVYVATYDDIPGIAHQIPYRMMIPKRVENLLVAGKCADGAYLVRDIPSVMTMGQAAGVAGALSARKRLSPRDLDIQELQNALREQHVILEIPSS